MKIIETTAIVENDGSIFLPDELIQDLQITPGDEMRIAYMPEPKSDGDVSQELFISRFGIMDLPDDEDDSDEEISIPQRLMDAAGFTPDTPIVAYCENGRIVIEADDCGQLTEDLLEISEALVIAANEVY